MQGTCVPLAGRRVALRRTAAAGVSLAIAFGAVACGDDEQTTTEPDTEQASDQFLESADELCADFATNLEDARSGTEAAEAIDDFVGAVNDLAIADPGSASVGELSWTGATLADDLDGNQGALAPDRREEIHTRVTTAAERAGITCPPPEG